MDWIGVVVNLFSNVVWAILLAILAVVLYFAKGLPKYRKLLRFFGISANKPKLRVYFSTLWIPAFGSVDVQGTPRSYQGPAIPEYEFGVISPILQPFSALRPRGLPRSVMQRLEAWGLFTIPCIEFGASPREEKDLQFDNLILVGSRAYNVATNYYVNRGNPYLVLDFDSHQPAVVVSRGKNKGERITAQADMAVLVKIIDQEHNSTVFIGAGMGVNGTRGAIKYLFDHWEELQARYGNQEFGLCLKVPPINEDPLGYEKPDVIRWLPH
jgi:hypothetical protein